MFIFVNIVYICPNLFRCLFYLWISLISVHICPCVCVCVHMFISVNIHPYLSMCKCLFVCLHLWILLLSVHICSYVCICECCVFLFISVHMSIPVNMFVSVNICRNRLYLSVFLSVNIAPGTKCRDQSHQNQSPGPGGYLYLYICVYICVNLCISFISVNIS